MNKLDNLLEKDYHIVEKRKVLFIIPLIILVIAAVMMIVFNFTLGSPLNLGTDFTGGYSIDVKLGNKLTDENYEEYCDRITEIMSEVVSEDGENKYNIKVDNMQRQGSGDNSAIHVKYFAVDDIDEAGMIKDVNPAIRRELEHEILMIIPTLTESSGSLTFTYAEVVDSKDFNDLKAAVDRIAADDKNSASITFDGIASDSLTLSSDNNKTVTLKYKTYTGGEAFKSVLISAMTLPDPYAGSVTQGDLVGATVSTELIFNAVLAVSLALIFMLCYIGLRFQLSSGLACIIALFHDILIMFAGMAIFRVEINNTFIAALITILGYSINNSIIIFDRVRENMRSVYAKNMTAEAIANKSIRETLLRSINTTITTLIMIVMIAIIGVPDIRIFALPIIFGLLAGTFSSICIAPSLWALFQRVGRKGTQSGKPQQIAKEAKA